MSDEFPCQRWRHSELLLLKCTVRQQVLKIHLARASNFWENLEGGMSLCLLMGQRLRSLICTEKAVIPRTISQNLKITMEKGISNGYICPGNTPGKHCFRIYVSPGVTYRVNVTSLLQVKMASYVCTEKMEKTVKVQGNKSFFPLSLPNTPEM